VRGGRFWAFEPELAAGLRRVKGAIRLEVRLGNWLTPEEARSLWQLPNTGTLKGKRDRAILAILLGCGLRRGELADLRLGDFQRREDHWAIVDLIGKAGHIRTVPVPDWVKNTVDGVGDSIPSDRRETVSVCLQSRKTVGQRRDRKGSLACREAECCETRIVECGSTRSPPILRTPVSCCRR